MEMNWSKVIKAMHATAEEHEDKAEAAGKKEGTTGLVIHHLGRASTIREQAEFLLAGLA